MTRIAQKLSGVQCCSPPRLVIARHGDNSMLAYGAPLESELAEAEVFRRQVNSASPRSRVIIPRHLAPIPLDPPRGQ